jgi:hypothetical protein
VWPRDCPQGRPRFVGGGGIDNLPSISGKAGEAWRTPMPDAALRASPCAASAATLYAPSKLTWSREDVAEHSGLALASATRFRGFGVAPTERHP